MRIYFAPCGIGLGHVGRVVPIARRLEKKADLVFSTYTDGIGYVEQEHFSLIKSPPVGAQVKPDGSIDFRKTAINPGPFLASFMLLNQIDFEIQAIEHFKPDVVVSDSRASSLLAAHVLGIPRICILNQFQAIVPRKTHLLHLAKFADIVTLTLIGKIWSSVKAVLIPDFPEPFTISVGNLTIPKSYRKSVKLIGPILPERPEQSPSKERLRERLGLPEDKSVIFVPISGPASEKSYLTTVIEKILLDFPDEYEIVMSYGIPNGSTKPTRHGNFTGYEWIPNRFEYLKASDVVIARAGHGTITQCMSYGKPMVLIPTPGQTEQISNARQADSLGIAKIALQDRVSRQRLLEKLQGALSDQMVEKTEEVQQEALKHDGLENAVKEILAAAQN